MNVSGEFTVKAPREVVFNTLRDPSSFDLFQATAAKSPTSSRDLLSVSATTGAVPASYAVEVMSLAKAEKVGGNVVPDATVALKGYRFTTTKSKASMPNSSSCSR